MIENVLMSVKE